MTIRSLLAPLLGLGLLLGARTAPATTPGALTATYNVSQGGQPMGVATVTLRAAGNGEWIYGKDTKGTGGLAALLGASVTESSRFRWKGDVPEAISYDYRMQTAVKQKQRHLVVDWPKNRVTVDEGKGPQSYPASPGMVERNTLALALGLALRDGKQQVALPVAVRQEVQLQHFKVTGRETVKVPAGSFDAERIDRTDADRGFSAWYAPDRYPLPVKLSQHDGGDLTMELVSYRND
ncbi:DUF3108 domain-containing protein [Rhodanobacter thiooxydans]|uniref:DUF3108 domain-containing protein n=1 Tax=Rhodanobacter thiooxydans TaxID=416169 RepID=UPI000D3DB631|nr:DUF3108 domain-containing protein [Rhodanobacter thiooxydans]